jgi:3-oxoacyl-[acyl-carrier-protein] synthase II
MENDVGIVGYDCLSPLGTTFRSTWQGLVNNRSGIRFIDRYDPAKETLKGVSVVEFGGQIPVAYAEMAGSSERFNRCPEPAHHCIGPVCRRLFEEIDFNIAQHDPQRIAILGATALTSEISQHTLTATQRPYVNFILNQCHNIPLTVVAKEFGLQGPSFSISGACASGNHAVFVGYHLVKTGLLDCASRFFRSALQASNGCTPFTNATSPTTEPMTARELLAGRFPEIGGACSSPKRSVPC